ncbi:MAG TPA: hypothetical protein VMF31_08305 [Solirubrobacterales bacterium]|nr:hypothetical protein [Solirubrobacterales bacterium]
MSEITHANELRGAEFKSLTRKTKTWVWTGLLAVALAVGGFLVVPVLAVAGLVLGLLIGLGIAFWIADHRAEEAFFDAYAQSRGLTRSDASLPELTPLLRKGDSRRTDELFTGPLNDEFEGSLALYTFTEESRDSDGDKTETHYPFTVVMISIPETARHVPELMLQRKSGLKALEKFEDAFRRNHERVTLESEAMRDRYEIFVRKEQDAVWVRRLFAPSFIVWLTETPPEKFAFELVDGNLCAYVPKHRDDAAGFDEMITVGTAVAKRLRGESAE